jgi:hypothetical protein
MNEDEIKNEMRLFALETVVCQLWGTMFTADPQAADRTCAQWFEGVRRPFPGVDDPAMSELYS